MSEPRRQQPPHRHPHRRVTPNCPTFGKPAAPIAGARHQLTGTGSNSHNPPRLRHGHVVPEPRVPHVGTAGRPQVGPPRAAGTPRSVPKCRNLATSSRPTGIPTGVSHQTDRHLGSPQPPQPAPCARDPAPIRSIHVALSTASWFRNHVHRTSEHPGVRKQVRRGPTAPGRTVPKCRNLGIRCRPTRAATGVSLQMLRHLGSAPPPQPAPCARDPAPIRSALGSLARASWFRNHEHRTSERPGGCVRSAPGHTG